MFNKNLMIASVITILFVNFYISTATTVPVCSGGFEYVSAENKTYCTSDTTLQRRAATELDCQFPFIFNGQWVDACIYDSLQAGYICSIDKTYNGRFALCQQHCPLLARIQTQNDPNNYTHPMCLLPASNVVSIFPTSAQKTQILNIHNIIRGNVSIPYNNASPANPTATNLCEMSWNDDIARLAQRWAENMVFQHNSYNRLLNFPNDAVGQNLFMSSGMAYDANTFWAVAMSGFDNEKKDFIYNTSVVLSKVGHYTQIVNARAIQVGCGAAIDGNQILAVCNYLTQQYGSELPMPYQSGPSCSAFAPTTTTPPGRCAPKYCQNNLGLCSKYCFNSGTLDRSSCTCQCPEYTNGTQCEQILCSKTDQEYGCWTPNALNCRFSNIPPICPHLCGICAYTY